jgi:hypothetical protein
MRRTAFSSPLARLLPILIACIVWDRSMAAEPSASRLVEAGDSITFYRIDLAGAERIVQRVEWTKLKMKRAADYIQLAARFDAGAETGFVALFVEGPAVERLLYRCPDTSETCTLTVDSEFQYGGDSDGFMRFLVFHDRSNEPYQYRFFDGGMADHFARGVQQFMERQGGMSVPGAETTLADVRKVATSGQKYLGKSLLDFSTSDRPKPPRLVEAGDEITFYLADLIGPERIVQLVEWSANLNKVQVNYIQLAAQFGAGAETDYAIMFVQESYADRLADRCQDPMAKKCAVTVDGEFQYGGDADRTMRFLVFHNRANQPYQHRFVSQTMAKNFAVGVKGLKQGADELNVPTFGAEMAVAAALKISEMGQAVFGDPLRDF